MFLFFGAEGSAGMIQNIIPSSPWNITIGQMEGSLRNDDPEIMAAQFAWPISMWMNLCDREPEREAEVLELLDRHVRQFFRIYGKD